MTINKITSSFHAKDSDILILFIIRKSVILVDFRWLLDYKSSVSLQIPGHRQISRLRAKLRYNFQGEWPFTQVQRSREIFAGWVVFSGRQSSWVHQPVRVKAICEAWRHIWWGQRWIFSGTSNSLVVCVVDQLGDSFPVVTTRVWTVSARARLALWPSFPTVWWTDVSVQIHHDEVILVHVVVYVVAAAFPGHIDIGFRFQVVWRNDL